EESFGPVRADGRVWASLPSHPEGLEFMPFHALHDRRQAVYFPRFDARARARWEQEQARARAEEQTLERGSVDHVVLGDEVSERAHGLEVDAPSYALSYRGRPGRDVRSGGALAFTLAGTRPARALRMRYWGEEHRRRFSISVNGTRIAREVLDGGRGHRFVDVDYPLPEALRSPADGRWHIRVEPEQGYSAGPMFGAWLLG